MVTVQLVLLPLARFDVGLGGTGTFTPVPIVEVMGEVTRPTWIPGPADGEEAVELVVKTGIIVAEELVPGGVRMVAGGEAVVAAGEATVGKLPVDGLDPCGDFDADGVDEAGEDVAGVVGDGEGTDDA
jgi:hypothetical protein